MDDDVYIISFILPQYRLEETMTVIEGEMERRCVR